MTWRVEFNASSAIFPSMNDDDLESLIRQTQPKLEFPVYFQREVWARIAIAEQQSWAARWRHLFQWMARPAPALATVTATLVLGIGLGGLTAPDESAAMRSAYIASINPLKAVHRSMPE